MRILHTLSLLLALSLTAGCAHHNFEQNRVHLEADMLPLWHTNAAGRAVVHTTFVVPRKALTRRQRLIVVPQMVIGADSVVAELTPLVADRCQFSRKLHRRQVLEGYADPYSPMALHYDKQHVALLPYADTLHMPLPLRQVRLRAMLTTDGCGRCTAIDTLAMGRAVNAVADLPQQLAQFAPHTFVVRPKVVTGQGEARLLFVVDKWDIRADMGRNRVELDSMTKRLRPVLTDSLATLTSLTISGAASAEGSYRHNLMLATNRAASARRWLLEQLHLPPRYAAQIKVSARPEGWQPVLAAMTAAGCKDSVLVSNILKQHPGGNDDVQERYIRRLACWPDIRDHYLAKDRRVTYTYVYTLRNFTTDAEMLRLYATRPDAFNEDELLHVADLQSTDTARMEVYRTTLRHYPQSVVAANNLAVLLLRAGHAAEAVQTASAIAPDRRTDTLRCTLAYAMAAQGRYAEARQVLGAGENSCLRQARQAIDSME